MFGKTLTQKFPGMTTKPDDGEKSGVLQGISLLDHLEGFKRLSPDRHIFIREHISQVVNCLLVSDLS